jgi:hypothetical protein
VKLAPFAPEGTMTEIGTATTPLLLARFTTIPSLGAAPLIVTAQLSLPAAFIEEFAQLRPDNEGVEFAPFPWSFTIPDTLAVVVVPATCN